MTYDPQLLTSGVSYNDIAAAAVKDRRRAARINFIVSLRQQRAEIQSRTATMKRQLAMGDGSVAVGVKRNEQRAVELTATIDQALEQLANFDAAPADFLDAEPSSKAKRSKQPHSEGK